LLVSRGVITCQGNRNRSGEEFGIAGVKQFLQAAPPSNASDLCASILKSVGEFRGNTPLCDDQTALALVRTT
jgi:serine phosphatase RsbU (regulator of sigma subunit)